MSRRSRPKVNHERWLVSYADFITLLFAFFVVLYAFAKADEKKQAAISVAIDKAFQSLSIASFPVKSGSAKLAAPLPVVAIAGHSPEQRVAAAKIQADLERMRHDLEKRLASQIVQGTVAIELGRDGLVISLREAGFFDSGSAVPRPDTVGTLRQIAGSLRGTPYDVRVEGHTDNVPIHNAEFDSNWELSSARATRIARLFLQMHAVGPEQLSADGYAEYHPLASNDTAGGRAVNRRVDLVVMPHAILDVTQPDGNNDRTNWRKIVDP
jgi:chemotaxis protein MotB